MLDKGGDIAIDSTAAHSTTGSHVHAVMSTEARVRDRRSQTRGARPDLRETAA
uniref:Uncharacterized protein n=1 Tax=Magallana gigas TaxID=29159 RepID=K1R5C5_MAGGI